MKIKSQAQGLGFHFAVSDPGIVRPIKHVGRDLLFEPEPTLLK